LQNKEKEMKKTIIGLVATTVLAGGAFADTVQFGNTWGDEGVGDNTSSSETATITTNGITFSLAITGSDKINLPSNADALGITGGNSGQSDNVRISATTNGPQEWIEFSLTVSGATENLNSLSLGNVGLDYLADGEGLDASDGTSSVFVAGLSSSLEYSDELTGLSVLSLANVGGVGDGTWKLRLTALDIEDDARVTDGFSNFQVTDLALQYTVIPEPATLGLITASAAGILFVRRRLMM
jgi:hypothetical protein